MLRHLCNSGCLEKFRNLKPNLRNVVHVAENVGGEERVSTRCNEIIVNTDLLDLEDLRPAFGQLVLEWRPWRDESARQHRAARETQFRCQANTLHFASRASWD